MRRYAQIYRRFFLSSLVRELEFKVNFIAKLMQNLSWVVFSLLVVVVLFSNVDEVAGWGAGEALILLGTAEFIGFITIAFGAALYEIPEQVRKGNLDFVITRPVDAQFWVSLRRCNFDRIGAAVAAALIVVVGVLQTESLITAPQVGLYLAHVACGIVIYYSFALMLMTTGIWFVKVDNLWVLSEMSTMVARYPLDIYGRVAQRILIVYIPVGLLAYVPMRHLVGDYPAGSLWLSVGWAVGFFIAARWFWGYALRHYSSASS